MRERDIEFFRPLWRRVAVVTFCLLWSAVEWATNAPLWGIITGGLAFYTYWHLIHTFDENGGGDGE